jgi:hypothetical protein
MHALLVALFLWGPTADVSRPADEPPPVVTREAAAPENPQPVVPPGPSESERIRQLREQLFARDALYLDDRANVIRYGRTIDAADAYLMLGRPDLANQVRERRSVKDAARLIGGTAMAGGLVWGVLDALATSVDNGLSRPWSCGSMSYDPECADRSHASAIPWLVALGGGLAWVTGALMPEDPLGSSTEKTGLISDYNQRLRVGIGLSGVAASGSF